MGIKHGILAITAASFMASGFGQEPCPRLYVPAPITFELPAPVIQEKAPATEQPSAEDAAVNPTPLQLSLGCDEVETITEYGTEFHACKDDLTERVRNGFNLIGKVKNYEREVLGFEATTNYTEYHPNAPAGVYQLSIVPLSALSTDITVVNISEVQEYRNEISGPTRLSSTVDDLADEEQHYAQQGYEVYRRFTPNFGTGCALTSELLGRATVNIIETVFEEDYHWLVRNVWNKLPQRDVEESTANLVSHAAVSGFVRDYIGENTYIYRRALESLPKFNDYAHFAIETYNELEAIVANNEFTDAERRNKVDELFQRAQRTSSNIRNAGGLFDALPYTRLFPLSYKVYQRVGDVREFIALMKEMPDDEYGAIFFLEEKCGCSYSPLASHVIED